MNKKMKKSKILITGIALFALAWITVFLLSSPETIPPLLNALLMVGIPIFLGVYFFRKLGAEWNTYAVGAATWGITFVLHLVFNAWVLNPFMETMGFSVTSSGLALVWTGILLGLAAGIFEETGRYVVYARFLPKARTWTEGLMLGAGHGGFEAIFFGALGLYTFLQMIVLKDLPPGQLSALVTPDKLDITLAQISIFWGTPWYDHLLGSLERISAIVIHLSMSLMVLNAVRKKNILWFFVSILWHTLTNALAVYSMTTWGAYVTEGILILLAIFSIGIIFFLQRSDPDTQEILGSDPQPPAPLLSTPEKVIITKEKLDESRYE